jgi:aerobic-type carbon monoxide dehydrogenase small subunit (CoxS/CutS family)
MSDDNIKNNERTGLNRRGFLKSAGIAVAGGTLGAGLTLTNSQSAEAAALALPATITEYGCPIDGKIFNTLALLQRHYAEAHAGAITPMVVKLNVNAKDYDVLIEPHWTLQRTLQYRLGLTGAKQMCDRGGCGSCTVIIDNRTVLSCTTLTVECEGKKIETVEGIAENKKWEPLFKSYCKWDAMQCGYCTPGFVVSAKALLEKNPRPTEDDCKQALAGNICCCGTYPRHPTAIMEAALQIAKGA